MAVANIKRRPYYTIEQYLAWEREADERNEFIDGEIYAKAGESGAHADISMNLAGLLQSQLKGPPAERAQRIRRSAAGPLRSISDAG